MEVTEQNIKCPFQPGIMVTAPERFWGRKYEKTKIITRIKNMESSSITGSRRIGKSSLAFFAYSYCKTNLPTYESIWIDCQDINIKSVDGLFQQINLNSPLNYTSGKTKKECLKNFTDALKLSRKRYILFIDEFDLLSDVKHQKQFDEGFFMQLRMIAGQGGNLALILVSKDALQDICGHALDISSPFYNIFAPFPLSLFSEEDVLEFLKAKHDGFKFSKKEANLIKSLDDYRHPLVLQIAGEAIYVNRLVRESGDVLIKKIRNQKMSYLNHEEVQREREKEKDIMKNKNRSAEISKPLDILISIFIPVFGIAIIVLEFGLLFRYLDNFKATLLSLVSLFFAMVVLVFAGRSINIIGETTFFKLYTEIIKKIPLLSNLLTIDLRKQK